MIGLPTGRAEQARPPIAPRSCVPQITTERDPFVKGDEHGIIGQKRLHQAIAAWQVIALGNESAEDAVPDDEHSAIIMVEIFGIGGVMHAMV